MKAEYVFIPESLQPAGCYSRGHIDEDFVLALTIMEWMIVSSLIGLGLFLVVLEVVFVPGTTLVGLVGFAFLLVGIVLSFNYFGRETGWLVLGGSAVVAGGLFYLAFKANVWKRFSLKSTMTGKMNEIDPSQVSAGMEGVALSALRPMGKAEINSQLFEVKTLGAYVASGSRLRVIQVMSNQIIVEPIL
jgi:membrane-bound ClpP family serine protease